MSRSKRKRKKRGTKLIKIMVIVLLIAGATIFALVSPIFDIEKITVQGNEKISTEEIINLSNLQIGDNIFRNVNVETTKNIKKEPYIGDVKIKRKLPGTVEITVSEREIAYQIQVIDSYIYIDEEGYILEKSKVLQKVPILEGMKTKQDNLINGTRLCKEDILYLNTVLKIITNAKKLEINDLITKIIIENNEYSLFLQSENKYAYLGNSSDITNKMLYIKAILGQEKNKSGKIFVNGDINDGFKPFFREEKI